MIIADHLAPSFEIHHHPPAPTDGTVETATFCAAARNGPSEGGRRIEGIDVDGDRIIVSSVLTLDLADGDAVEIPNTAHYTMAEEKIVRIDSHYGPDAVAAMTRAGAFRRGG